ncbi:hypothetical protein [Carnobacterium divergens]|uniref:hypothetical protein n=1 Tax=Carnobacterium divergens TaxID=2748 RepID=UPI0029C96891|nr:hypothetical protein [Carnobacterium divergens]
MILRKKTWVLVGILIFILIGGVSWFMFNQNETQRKEQQIVKMETTTAKQIKNTFTDVTEIKFSERYGENRLTGYTETMVTVSTSYGVNAEIGVSMSPKDKINQSYVGSGEPTLRKGITGTEVRVIFSNKDEGSF